MTRMILRTAVALAVLLTLSASAATAASGPNADLGGRPLRLDEVGEFYCHDFAFPAIHCFRSEEELDRAVADWGAGPLAKGASNTLAGITYVHVWVDAGYYGNSAYLSQDYRSLGDIGWNDKISSLVVMNLQSGAFYEHNDFVGFVYHFCCGSAVTYVGDYYNDKFSSVKNLT